MCDFVNLSTYPILLRNNDFEKQKSLFENMFIMMNLIIKNIKRIYQFVLDNFAKYNFMKSSKGVIF